MKKSIVLIPLPSLIKNSFVLSFVRTSAVFGASMVTLSSCGTSVFD